MVRKKIGRIAHLLLFVLATEHASASAQMLFLHWDGDKSKRCQVLMETFLHELRSLAGDTAIELEAYGDERRRPTSDPVIGGARKLSVTCALAPGAPGSPSGLSSLAPGDAIVVDDGRERMTLRYLAKAQGFDSMDWLPFQRRYLRPTADVPDLPVNTPAEVALEPSRAVTTATLERGSGESIFKTWWFWSAVVALGAGTYGVIKASQRHSGMSIDIQ